MKFIPAAARCRGPFPDDFAVPRSYAAASDGAARGFQGMSPTRYGKARAAELRRGGGPPKSGSAVRFRLADPADEPRGVAAHHRKRRHVVRDHAVRTDDRPVTDGHAGQNGGIDADPRLVLDDDGAAVSRTAVAGIGVVVDGDEVHLRGDEHVVAQRDPAAVEERASLLDPAAFADPDVLPEVHVERRQQRHRFVDFPSGDAREVAARLVRRPEAVVQFVSELHRLEDGGDQPVVTRLVGRNHRARAVFLENVVHSIVRLSVRKDSAPPRSRGYPDYGCLYPVPGFSAAPRNSGIPGRISLRRSDIPKTERRKLRFFRGYSADYS